jgi:hypothetical protein
MTRRLLIGEDQVTTTVTVSLDDAWAAAEAAMPSNWAGPHLITGSILNEGGRYAAWADEWRDDGARFRVSGHTPVEALILLAARLRAVTTEPGPRRRYRCRQRNST